MKGRILSLFALTLLLFFLPLTAQDSSPAGEELSFSSADDLLKAAREAIRKESYPYALRVLTRGEELFPEDYRISRQLGELYTNEELYNLALGSFLRADRLEPDNLEVLDGLAGAYGRLNLNSESVEVMEKLYALFPDNLSVIADLGWMYFKTYRAADGAKLLTGALEAYGETPGMLMTLGTLYTSLYDYEGGREYYRRSIEAADKMGWDYFSSVAWYNLALLDFSFYKYDLSLEGAGKSLDIVKRSSGYICLGELALSRLDYPAALDAFTQAYNLDETPLSLVSLAELYYQFGMLEAALSHAREAESRADSSWMYYFGVDPERHRMDLHELYGKIYRSMGRRALKEPSAPLKRIPAFFRGLKYRMKSWYHTQAYRRLALKVGDSYRTEGAEFDSDLQYYYALEAYPAAARKYLERCEQFEMEVAPESFPFYRYEVGKLEKDADTLYEALEGFDPKWERSAMDDALSVLIPLIRDREEREALNLLFSLNPGAFLREGFHLPVVIEGNHRRGIERQLERSGITIFPEESSGLKYKLRIDETDNGCYFSFWDLDEGQTIWTERSDYRGEGQIPVEIAAQQILQKLYKPR